MADWVSDKSPKGQHRWGMVVDLDRCTGCSACVVACHAENNLAIAGPTDTDEGRSFDWIRIERYWEGDFPDTKAHFVPIMCQHCEAAPCEPVCPVYATYHTPEGLNSMVYVRCIGTRFCQNNDPYNVRFFNWFEPALNFADPLPNQLNPDVTVRSRGVMEKCSFCVQRIRRAEDDARLAGRKLADGEFTTACAQSCSARALVFGDLTDSQSEVSRLAESARRFRLLESLGTNPVVYYLKGGQA
ncbi:MAG: 4Fe-4S dicluster domain-containing protein [Cyanobacteria bacterium NC_groundwater_1444_Ag_S-0.65um_54_12]|nr:4Fe-4S dicluster domain-containing protein [Cyanobacteria bacterium NC_groundwater_1444_Ag_S-0.65um_54_12]